MHCNCCDNQLSPEQIVWNKDIKTFEMCSNCLTIALEAAFSGDFSPDKADIDDPEFENEFGRGFNETLDSDVFVSYNPYADDFYDFGYKNIYDEDA